MMKGERSVCLVSAADNRYVKPLAVLLKSAELNLAQDWALKVYVLDGGISWFNRRCIMLGLDSGRVSVIWISMRRARALSGLPVFGHISVATYFRVLVADLLPKVEKKVIYIDADAVVLGDLSELWQMDMKGKAMMAVQDGNSSVSSGGGIPEYALLGIPANTEMFNAGVFVSDLDKWREANVARQVLAYLKRNHDKVKYWDQDGLNAILSQDAIIIPKRWNYRVDCHEAPQLSCETVVQMIRKNAAVVHYASATKPWHYYAEHPGKMFFFEYIDFTAWKGWRPRIPLKSLGNRHFWGSLIGRIPVVGMAWKRWRREQ
jgi:lipopolysaccharide biosynthesis glycosyltransferase